MMRAALRRVATSFALVFAVVSLAFAIEHGLPSDAARAIAGPQARPADVARLREQLALDRPLATRYARYLGRLVHLAPRQAAGPVATREHEGCASLAGLHVDLGTSYQKRRPVLALLLERLPRTLSLALGATLVQIVVGVGLGTLAAARRGRALDHAVSAAALVGVSAPTFLTGLALQWTLAYRLRLVPLDGFGRTMAEHLACLVLPSLTLGLFGAAYATRIVRDEMGRLLASDWARTARAKGASQLRVVAAHALRNALLPIVTIVGLDLGSLVGGAVVTEKLFRWPGIGQLAIDAIVDRDGPLVMGTVLVSATAVIAASALVDAAYALLDPRVRHGEGLEG